MSRSTIGKISGLFGLAAFGVSLLVLMVIPMLTGRSVESPGFRLAQAAAIGLGIALVFSWFQDRVRADDPLAAEPSPDEAGDALGAEKDPDTGMLNQRGLTVKLLEMMALGERYGNNVAVAIIGIDHLGEVNEKYGREAAHKGLVAIAAELADTLRMPDRLGRWTDDQLIVILPETSLDGARHIGERLRESASQVEFEAKRGVLLSLTTSIGVTVFRRGDDLQALLSRASRAMVAAQQQGCNRVLTDLAA